MARQWTSRDRPVGDRLAPKIAVLVEHVLTEHLRKSSQHRAKIGTQAALDFFATLEAERDEHLADLLGLFTGHEGTHPAAEKLLAFMHHGHGELAELLVHNAVGGAAQATFGQAMNQLLAPILWEINEKEPNTLLAPTDIAAAFVRGLATDHFKHGEMIKQGFDESREAVITDLAQEFPSFGEMLDLWRRGQVDEGQVLHVLQRAGIDTIYSKALTTLKREHLSIADAALAVLRGAISEDEGIQIAAVNGYDKKDFETFTYNTGEPPGLEQLLEAYRREFIDDARLKRGIKQSRVRDEWIDVVEKLRFEPASPADAIRGAVQNHISKAEAKKICEQGGLEPSAFEWMFETAGNPPGTMQMVELYVRGRMTKGQLEQGIRESRYKDKYVQQIIDLKRKIPSIYQINTLLKAGSITEAEGARLLAESGYEADVAKSIVHTAAHGAIVKEKQLAKAEVLELYEDKAISEAETLKLLEALGYHGNNAKLMLRLVELKRERSLRNAAMSPVRTEYVNRRIEEKEAELALNALGLPHEQVSYSIALWTIERDTHTKFLSEAQVVKANTLGLISDAEAEKRLMGIGYPQEDARLLLDSEKGRTKPAP